MTTLQKKIEYVLSNLEKTKKVIEAVKAIRGDLITATIDGKIKESDFYRVTSLLTSQSRSTLYESYYIKKHEHTKVPSHEGKGDFIDAHGRYYEYKVSGENDDNALHIVQIRPHQNVSYIVQRIMNDTNKIFTFKLTKRQMQKEIKKIGQSAHGTKKAVRGNITREYRMTIPHQSADWDRWVANYLVK